MKYYPLVLGMTLICKIGSQEVVNESADDIYIPQTCGFFECESSSNTWVLKDYTFDDKGRKRYDLTKTRVVTTPNNVICISRDN